MLNQDVTSLEQNNEFSQWPHNNFARIVHGYPTPVVIVDPDRVILYANRAAEAIFNSPELAGAEFPFPVFAGRVAEVELEAQPEPVVAEMTALETEWNGRAALLISLRDVSAERRATQALEKARDDLTARMDARARELKKANEYLLDQIAERRRAERSFKHALVEAEQARDRIDAIFKSVADGLIVTDRYNRLVMINQAAEAILAVSLDDSLNQPVDAVIPNEVLWERIKVTLAENGRGRQFDFEAVRPGGSNPRSGATAVIRARTAVIRDRNNQPGGVITIIHDVTREREVDRMKTEFISTASHELRTPLTSIQGFSEILLAREGFSRDDQKKYLGYIHHQAEAMSRIVNDLLNISLIESGQSIGLDKTGGNISDLVLPVVASFEELSPKHRFDVALASEPSMWVVDREKIEQVLKNLLSNAIKYAPDGGLIRLRGQGHYDAQSAMRFYQISVADQGIGMSPDQVERMFEKFYRADASNTAIAGIGLGMAIVKNIVEAHGGRIWVDSHLGAGTTVSFAIPVGE